MVIYHSFFCLYAFGIKLRSLEKIYCLYMSYASTCIYPELCPSSNKLLKYLEMETNTALILSLT